MRGLWTHDIIIWCVSVIRFLLHFAWGVAEAKCIGHGRLRACLSVPRRSLTLQLYTDRNVTCGVVRVPSRCTLLGGFAIGARVSLLWQHSAEREMSASACTRSMPVFKVMFCILLYFKMPTLSWVTIVLDYTSWRTQNSDRCHYTLARNFTEFRPTFKNFQHHTQQ